MMEVPDDLNGSLIKPAQRGDVARLAMLLAAGADISKGTNRTALIWAAYHGHAAAVMLLLGAGADRFFRQEGNARTASQFARQQGHEKIATMIDNYVHEPVDQVITRRPLADLMLQEIFNFTALERISIVRNDKTPVAVTRERFADVADQSALRRAFEEHRRRGGTTDEAAVFPNRLAKNLLPKGAA